MSALVWIPAPTMLKRCSGPLEVVWSFDFPVVAQATARRRTEASARWRMRTRAETMDTSEGELPSGGTLHSGTGDVVGEGAAGRAGCRPMSLRSVRRTGGGGGSHRRPAVGRTAFLTAATGRPTAFRQWARDERRVSGTPRPVEVRLMQSMRLSLLLALVPAAALAAGPFGL